MSPTLPFGAPILQRAKDGVCQRARGRVVRLGTAVCCFQGVSCAKSVAGGMVFCDGDVCMHMCVSRVCTRRFIVQYGCYTDLRTGCKLGVRLSPSVRLPCCPTDRRSLHVFPLPLLVVFGTTHRVVAL